jgi:N-acetylmuramoyl-L-alanine amidase
MWGDEQRVKRRLLRELVDENVELKAGRALRPRRSRRSRLPWPVKAVGLAAAPAALFASSLVLSGAVDPGRWPTAQAEGAPAAPRPSVEAPAPAGGPAAPAPALPALATPAAAGSAPAQARPALATAALEGDVFPLAVRRIVLDPGHGGANTGTRTPGGLEEKFLTLDIAKRLRATL